MHRRDKVQRSLISISKRKERGREECGKRRAGVELVARPAIGNFVLDPLSKHAREISSTSVPRGLAASLVVEN